jgi:hypothetical protein
VPSRMLRGSPQRFPRGWTPRRQPRRGGARPHAGDLATSAARPNSRAARGHCDPQSAPRGPVVGGHPRRIYTGAVESGGSLWALARGV